MTHPLIANPETYYQDEDYLSNSSLSNFVSIPMYPWYELCISTNEVRSVNFNRTWVSKILSKRYSRKWHLLIACCVNWSVINTSVHRIVYEMYKGKIPKWLVVCHNDSNPQNNHPKNLRADTQKSNVKDCMLLWRHNSQTNNPTPRYKWKDSSVAKKVVMKSIEWIVIKTFDTVTDAAQYIKRSAWCISSACNWLQKTSAGHRWEFI